MTRQIEHNDALPAEQPLISEPRLIATDYPALAEMMAAICKLSDAGRRRAIEMIKITLPAWTPDP